MFSRNPFQIIDDGLLAAGAAHSRFLYRCCGLHPLTHRHIYRLLVTVGSSVTLVLMNKTNIISQASLAFIPLLAILNWKIFHRELPRIRSTWDEGMWRYYLTLAGMKQAEDKMRLMALILMTFIACSLVQDSIELASFSPYGGFIIASLMFIVSIYVEDADPPEPDDGHLEASPAHS